MILMITNFFILYAIFVSYLCVVISFACVSISERGILAHVSTKPARAEVNKRRGAYLRIYGISLCTNTNHLVGDW